MTIGCLNKGGKEGLVHVGIGFEHRVIRQDTYKEFEQYIPEYTLVFLVNDVPLELAPLNLKTYTHPEKAIYIFGDNSEDKISFYDEVKDLKGDFVEIPCKMIQDDHACAVVLYDRLVKLNA